MNKNNKQLINLPLKRDGGAMMLLVDSCTKKYLKSLLIVSGYEAQGTLTLKSVNIMNPGLRNIISGKCKAHLYSGSFLTGVLV